jgi:hypothetical protein
MLGYAPRRTERSARACTDSSLGLGGSSNRCLLEGTSPEGKFLFRLRVSFPE